MTKEDLQQISNLMDEKLEPIKKDISEMKNDISQLKEDVEIIKEDAAEVRVTVEEICKWIDLNFDHKYPFPIDKNIGVG